MEGKRVKYRIHDCDLKYVEGRVLIENWRVVEKLGTIVGVFENGKVCVKCDEDKLIRLFNIEKLVVVDEEYEKAKLNSDELGEIFSTYLPKNKGELAFDYSLRCNEFYHTSPLFDKYKVSAEEMIKNFIKGEKL